MAAADESLDNLADKLAQEAEAMTAALDKKPSGDGGDGASSPITGKDRNLQMILDIPLRVTVELGRTKMPVSELLNLTQGSVIELSKLAGEPMEVYVNDKLIARGEAVVVNEKFGVRLTDIISPSERVEQLK
jgi:flagellar motor switch protein FliN